MLDAGKYSKGNEKFVEQVRDDLILAALTEGRHVIVDDTNLNPKHEETIRELVHDWNAVNKDNVQVEVKEFNCSVEECIERDKKRAISVGADVILKMARQWCPDKYGDPVPEIDMEAANANGLPWCVIYDLDGTAAIMGDRSPYDASKCDEVDRPNLALLEVLTCIQQATPTHMIALSGRSAEYRLPTERFIEKHGFPCNALYMRADGDSRKDAIIKGELYDAHIKGKFNVLVVFDDRNQMVDFWRKDAGLPCFQVNYGDF